MNISEKFLRDFFGLKKEKEKIDEVALLFSLEIISTYTVGWINYKEGKNISELRKIAIEKTKSSSNERWRIIYIIEKSNDR